MQILNGMASGAIFVNCFVVARTLTANDTENDFENICQSAFATLTINTVILAGYLLAQYF